MKKKKKKLVLKNVLVTAISVIAAIGSLILIIWNVFTVTKVEVEGNHLYDEIVIKDAVLNDEHSWNTLYVFLKYTFMETEKIPFIDTMEIAMKDVNTLQIKVYEKGLLGYLYIPTINQNAYFDKDGLVTETSERLIPNVPLIEGIACTEVILHEKLPIENTYLRQLLTLTQGLKRKELQPDSIVYGVENEPVLKYGDVSVYLGSLELLTQKIERLEQILPSLEGKSGILHLEKWTEDTTNTIFKVKTKEELQETTEVPEETEKESQKSEESEENKVSE